MATSSVHPLQILGPISTHNLLYLALDPHAPDKKLFYHCHILQYKQLNNISPRNRLYYKELGSCAPPNIKPEKF